MLKISEFFKRIQGRQAKEILIRTTIQSALEKHVGVSIPLECISFNNTTAYIGGISQTAKSVIFIRKQILIHEINSQQNIRPVTDIK